MTAGRFSHFAAIDWSGAVGPVQKGIAVALCQFGTEAPQLIARNGGWSREKALDWLRNEMPANTLVGLDLGPSLPFIDKGAFFPTWSQSPPDARTLWALVEDICTEDPCLAATSFVDHPQAARHFRRHGNRKGDLFTGRGRLRVTEEAQRVQGLNPYSNHNLVGAAQVGKSSLTGMRVLHRLNGKLPVWPFDASTAGSLVVEIYTTIAALAGGRPKGRSKMKTVADLNAALAVLGSATISRGGAIDDHSSDAILTAAWLRTVSDREELWHPHALNPEIARTEGWTFGVT